MPAVHVETSRTRIGVQGALETASSNMRPIVCWGDTNPIGKAKRKTFANQSQTARRRDAKAVVKGPRTDGPIELTVALKRLASVLNASATPVAYSHASALSHQLLYRAIFGAELTPTAGSTVASSSGTPVDTITVASGHGGRFVVGQVFVLVDTALYVRRVTGVSTDAVSFHPPLPNGVTPTVGAVVRSTYCYYPGERDSTVFTVDHAWVESGTAEAQRRAIGCYGQGEFTTNVDEVGAIKFTGSSVSHTDPDDLSLSTDPTADDMGGEFTWVPTIYWMTSLAAAPSAVAEITSLKISVPRKWQVVPGATINGKGSVHEVAGRGEPITIEFAGLVEKDWWTAFEAGTKGTLVAYTSDGSDTSARVAGFWVGTAYVSETPEVEFLDRLVSFKATLTAQTDVSITGADPALSVAGIRTANLVSFLG